MKARTMMDGQITEVSSLADLNNHFADGRAAGPVRIDLSLIADNPDFDVLRKKYAVTARVSRSPMLAKCKFSWGVPIECYKNWNPGLAVIAIGWYEVQANVANSNRQECDTA